MHCKIGSSVPWSGCCGGTKRLDLDLDTVVWRTHPYCYVESFPVLHWSLLLKAVAGVSSEAACRVPGVSSGLYKTGIFCQDTKPLHQVVMDAGCESCWLRPVLFSMGKPCVHPPAVQDPLTSATRRQFDSIHKRVSYLNEPAALMAPAPGLLFFNSLKIPALTWEIRLCDLEIADQMAQLHMKLARQVKNAGHCGNTFNALLVHALDVLELNLKHVEAAKVAARWYWPPTLLKLEQTFLDYLKILESELLLLVARGGLCRGVLHDVGTVVEQIEIQQAANIRIVEARLE